MGFSERITAAKGRLGIWQVRNGIWIPKVFQKNQLQYTWAHVLTQLCRGNTAYRPSAFYIEFENAVAGTITVPSFGRDEGLEYFNSLQYSGTKDFLRVAILQDPSISIASGYENYFTDGVSGNTMSFFGMTSGGSGVLGKTFAAGSSTVYGAALVATPVFSDRTQDVIFARTYLPVDEQVTQEASHQIGITWDITFE